MVILPIRPQTFLDLLQEPAVPPTLFCPMESAVIPLLIDAQRPKHGHHWPTAQVGVDEAVLPAGVYGLRRLAKKPAPPGESPRPAGPAGAQATDT